MTKNILTIVLIPAYEPDEKLPALLRALKAEQTELICVVVDDGSGAACAPVFTEAEEQAIVLRHAENRGKGAALKTGLRFISDTVEPPYIVVTADADGQHLPADILRVSAQAAREPDVLVLGSRRIEKHTPLRSRLGNTITRGVFRLSAGTRVYDTQTGLRSFSDRAVPFLAEIPGERYEYEMNMLLMWAQDKRPIREVWIETVYLDGNSSSHFDAVKDSARIYKEILKFSGASFVSFLIDYGLFCLLHALTRSLAQGLIFSNIAARLISASVNYTLNRRAVFRSSAPVAASAPRYAALAAGILLANTLILKGLTALGMPAAPAKLLTEAVLFIVSWSVQRTFVFSDRRENSPDKEMKPE